MENAWSDFVDGYTGQGSFGKGTALEGDPSARWPGARAARAMRELTEIMAAENRARGPVGKVTVPSRVPVSAYDPKIANMLAPEAKSGLPEGWYNALTPGVKEIPDPLDQSLRASYYHGLSGKAREKVLDVPNAGEIYNKLYPLTGKFPSKGAFPDWDFELSNKVLSAIDNRLTQAKTLDALDLATERGFPISLHNAESISNKLGEPAGVSLSALPSKSGPGFAADRYTVHRVMPLYGKNPREATVDLLTEEGRTFLQDSYDAVANRGLEQVFRNPEVLEPLLADIRASGGSPNTLAFLLQEAVGKGISGTGSFNKALSEQMQAGGKRFLRYNPKRWGEHELLALDPKYALPVDYRAYTEYPGVRPTIPHDLGMRTAMGPTPGYIQALEQLQPLMQSSPERLGDIYAQRPWGERLRPEVKAHILDQLKAPEQRSMMERFFEGRLEAPNTKVPEVKTSPEWGLGTNLGTTTDPSAGALSDVAITLDNLSKNDGWLLLDAFEPGMIKKFITGTSVPEPGMTNVYEYLWTIGKLGDFKKFLQKKGLLDAPVEDIPW